MVSYTVPSSCLTWYKHSLSSALHQVARSGQYTFSPKVALALEAAGANVFAHEYYFQEMYAGRRPFQDKMFVYEGYYRAMADLLKLLGAPTHDYNDRYIHTELKGHLQNFLCIVCTRCEYKEQLDIISDRQWQQFRDDLVAFLKP